VLFALMLERVGLIPATLTLVMVSSLAESRWQPRRAAVLALAMTTFIYVLFILVLHVPISALKW
jgi:Tripartite tricarboxylate transporter TctB family